MPDVFDVELFTDSSADEVDHQLHRLRQNALWQEAAGDTLHPSNKMARRVMESLVAAKDQALQAERFQAAALPADTDPADAKAMLDRYMADPKFRCAYRDEDHPNHQRISQIAEQLLNWAHGGPAGADDQTVPQPTTPGDDGVQPGQTIADRLADGAFLTAYLDAAHPGHAEAMAQMTTLHQAAAGEPTASE